MKYIVLYSGGLGSFFSAKYMVEKQGKDNVVLLFADTNMEEFDLYQFLRETSEYLQVPVTTISDGRTPWDVFFDERMMGNTKNDPCSKILKRKLVLKWLKKNYKPDECKVVIGIDWTEEHRFNRALERFKPYQVEAPLCTDLLLDKKTMKEELAKLGINLSRSYQLGFSHSNCGNFCVKAGYSHFKHLLEKLPERYKQHEEMEQKFREWIGKDVSIMKKRIYKDGKEYYGGSLTMREFREKIERAKEADPFSSSWEDQLVNYKEEAADKYDWGGCGCAI